MEPGLACLLARDPWDGDPGGRKRQAGRLVGAQAELAPEVSIGSHWLPSLGVLLYFKTFHFEVYVSESFLPHSGTIQRFPYSVCSPLPQHHYIKHKQIPGTGLVSGVCPAVRWWEALLLIAPHRTSDDLPFTTFCSPTASVDLGSPQRLS